MRICNPGIRVNIFRPVSIPARKKRHASAKPHHDFLQHDDIVHAHAQEQRLGHFSFAPKPSRLPLLTRWTCHIAVARR